jgi:hypothetical protein
MGCWDWTGERVALDLLGPLPLPDMEKVYLLAIQDCNTKWVEMAPLPNKSASVIAEVFANMWVVQFRPPLDTTPRQRVSVYC